MLSSALVALVIWVGTSGFGAGRQRVYRDTQVVEIQQTFYRPVAVTTARSWRDGAPAAFRFVMKASQFITHPASSPTYRRAGRPIPEAARPRYGGFQDTAEVREGWEATRVVAEVLRAHAIVFQTPASFGPSEAHVKRMYRFFESIDSEAVKALELRGPWASHLVEKMCADLGLVHAVDPFARESTTAGLAYFRLHGSPPGARMYAYTYTDADLGRLKALAAEYDDAYVLFNNHSMRSDARRFRSLLDENRGGSGSSVASQGERFL